MDNNQPPKKDNRIKNDEGTRASLMRIGKRTYLLHWDHFEGQRGSIHTFRLSPVRAIVGADSETVEAWERDFSQSVKRVSGLEFDGIGDAEEFARVFMAKVKNYNEAQTKAKARGEQAKVVGQ